MSVSVKDGRSANCAGIRMLKVLLFQGDTVSLKNGRGLGQGCCCHEFYSITTTGTLTMQAIEGFRLENRSTRNLHCEICR